MDLDGACSGAGGAMIIDVAATAGEAWRWRRAVVGKKSCFCWIERRGFGDGFIILG